MKVSFAQSMNRTQTKAVSGILSICIILHHISQKTAMQLPAGDPAGYVFAPFRNIGYLFVAWFFYTSGYGLKKSLSLRRDYLKDFLIRHLTPVIFSFLVTDVLFQYPRIARHVTAFPANSYSWFVFIILILYVLFHFCFSRLGKHASSGLIILSLFWCILCRFVYADNYWYNSVLAFPLGVCMATAEPKISEKLEKAYAFFLTITFSLTFLFGFGAADDMRLYRLLGSQLDFSAVKDIQVILQIISALLFCLLITAIGMKISIRGRVSTFLGSITLETYLLHVLFVELFSEKFLGRYKTFFYIRNPFLYLLSVLLLTLPSAFLLRLLRDKVTQYILKSDDTAWAIMILRSAALLAGAVFVLAVAYFSVASHRNTNHMQDEVKTYAKTYETYVTVDGRQMSAYVTGEGDHTILLLSDLSDPASSMLLRPLAEQLGKQARVIVPDYFGSGFSDSADSPRSSQELAYEMHEAAKELAGSGPVTLFSFGSSGIYAQTYASLYPDDVEGLIGFDMVSSKILQELYDKDNLSKEQLFYETQKSRNREKCYYGFLNATGFIQMEVATYYEALSQTIMKDHLGVLGELFIAKYDNPESVQAEAYMMTDAREMRDYTFPKELPVLFFSSNSFNMGADKKAADMYKKLFTNEEIQRCSVVVGNSMIIYIQPEILATRTEDFLKGL